MTMDKPYAITLDVLSSLANHTGTWRTERPVYLDRTPPCQAGCPAGEDPQAWLYLAEEGRYREAWTTLVADNPMPATMGRICYHPCETVCNRAQLDSAVGINSIERFLGDQALAEGWPLPEPAASTGRRVLVVGAGPAGLALAYHLRRRGHAVTVREASDAPGGMMAHAIPAFRLPRSVLRAEIDRLLATGIDLRLSDPVTDLAAVLDQADHDAVFLAVGAQLSSRAYIPAGQSARVLDALTLLGEVAAGARPHLGRRVATYGGGNTAMDVARTARRLGAEESVVIYRRDRARMPANDVELAEALEEGVQVRWLSTVADAEAGSIRVERMVLDDQGRPVGTGEYDTIDSDCLVLALGQQVDHSWLDGLSGLRLAGGTIAVDDQLMTGHPGVFAGGDMVTSSRSVTASLGHGRTAAACIDRWLGTRADAGPPAGAVAESDEVVPFEALNSWYFSDAPAAIRPRLEAGRRTADFSEVVGGLDEQTARYEARRCLSCGNCFGCDNCFGVCPDNAVHKVAGGHGYEIDYDYCKGCGLCVAECPCGAIVMQDEP